MEYKEIEKKVLKFRDDRNWAQFHQIKDLLLGLNIEVGELQELFLWKSTEEQNNINKERVSEELADIAIFLVYISKHFDIDLIEAMANKLDKNDAKYPVEKSHGSNKKYNAL